MTVDTEEATEILHDLDFDTLELDESYAVRELENLSTKARDGFIAENKKYDFNLPKLTQALDDTALSKYSQLLVTEDERFTKMFKELTEWINSLPKPN
jgi:hypothetical protein